MLTSLLAISLFFTAISSRAHLNDPDSSDKRPQLTFALRTACEKKLIAAKNVQSLMDFLWDQMNPATKAINKVFGISHREIAPPAFFMPTEKGLILGINGVSKSDIYHLPAEYMSGAAFRVPGFVEQTQVKSPEQFLHRLTRFRRVFGPIHRLVIAAHGESGSLSIGQGHLTLKWVLNHEELVDALPDDLFTADAEVALVSCEVASGSRKYPQQGELELREIFSRLLRKGGVVRAATRYVDPELGNIPPSFVKSSDRIVRNLIYCPLLALDASVRSLVPTPDRREIRKFLIPAAEGNP